MYESEDGGHTGTPLEFSNYKSVILRKNSGSESYVDLLIDMLRVIVYGTSMYQYD